MAESKNTKRALAASIGCVALCSAMLVGTTFAWFTDTASTSINKIQSGTLDVDIVDANDATLTDQTLSFVKAEGGSTQEVLWEPGATYKTGAFYIKNAGSLALKYKLDLAASGDADLLEAIDFVVVDSEGTETALSTFESNLSANTKAGPYYIQGHMQESAGNQYQGMTLDGIKLTVSATQYTEEYDSTTNQYDAAAEYATPVSTVDELAAAIAKGEDVVLKNDVELPAALELTSDVTIYGNGSTKLVATSNNYGTETGTGRVINVANNTSPVTLTLSGVDIVGPTESTYNRGINVYGNSDVTIVMDNCSASANHYAFNIASDNANVNITVRNTTLEGYSAFQTYSANTNATFENCTLTGVNQWSGDSDQYAAIVIAEAAKNSNLTFTNCKIESKMTGDALSALLFAWGVDSEVTFNGCTFYINGTQLTTVDEIVEWMGADDSATISIN